MYNTCRDVLRDVVRILTSMKFESRIQYTHYILDESYLMT